jgi:hypothetical protein
MAKSRINDEERRQWLLNDEGLYEMCRRSGRGEARWIRENRALIDEVIVNVQGGHKPQQYLKYGEGPTRYRPPGAAEGESDGRPGDR